MTSPVALLLGSGPRVGAAVTEAFLRAGYRVAIAARKGTGSRDNQGVLSIKADFADADSITMVFDVVKMELGAVPTVVVYNAAAMTPPPDKESALSIPVDDLTRDMNVNVISPYAAAQESVKGWASLPVEQKKLFIFTGNIQNQMFAPMPMMLTLGAGKAALAHWIGLADATYSAKCYRFIYADERDPDGKNKGLALDGPAHGEFYTQLAISTAGVPWHATFVKGEG